MIRIIASFCLIVFVGLSLQAQPIREFSFKQKIEAAELAESEDNFAGALSYYEDIYNELKQDKKNRRGNPQLDMFSFKMAEMEYRIRDFERAEKRYDRILKKDEENQYADYRYMFGLCLKANAKYTEALKEFNKVISLSEDEALIARAEFQIEGIESLRTLEPNVETAIGVLDKSINSPSGEFSPRLSADGDLYYGSLNRKTVIELGSGKEDEYHAKIYMASRNDEGKFEDGEELGQNINRIGFHNAQLAFSRDGRTMYFTRTQTTGTKITSTQIMVSYKRESGWTAAVPVVGINGDWDIKHPASGELFGKDVLFFASNMDGTVGGFDLFYSTIKSDGSLSAPVNLGKNVNTEGDELSPYYYEGTLYYSTDGKPTIGGFDIFYSIWDGSKWSQSENIGLGYNSSYDDLYFAVNPDGLSGFFVSNRPTDDKRRLKSKTCCDDIFEFQIRQIVIDLLAIVVDDQDAPLDGATITLDNISDPVNYPPDSKFNSLGNEFQFLLDADFEYRAIATREGYNSDTIEFTTAGLLDNYTFNKKVVLTPKKMETRVVTVNEPIRLDNIYYDFDDDKILPDAEDDLEFLLNLMEEYPDMVIELSSHTDSQGGGRYNLELSQRRAESAKRWLQDNGVKSKRINPVGYGERNILNKCKNGVECTDDEHRFNRRTEFKIIAGPKTIEITREVEN